MYTVPEGYKFIGFLATAGCTTTLEHATDSSGYITGITTNVTVSNDLSKGLTITADIRKILKVDITMTANAKFVHSRFLIGDVSNSEVFKINKISINSNAMYSINYNDWKISNGTSDLKQNMTGTQRFYILEGKTDITITIDDFDVKAGSKSQLFTAADIPNFETTGCTKPANNSPFTFTITNSDVTIKWSGEITKKD